MSAIRAAFTDAPAEHRTKKIAPKDCPWPLTAGHPLRAIRNRVQTIGTSFILGGHGLAFTFVGLYFLLFELSHGQIAHVGSVHWTMPDVKGYWDTLLSRHVRLLSQAHWDTWRHLFRDGGEPFLATLGVFLFLYNPYKYSVKKLDSAKEMITYILAALIAAIPIFILGGLLVSGVEHWFHTGVLAPALGTHPNLAQKLYADGWTTKVIASFAGIVVGRRVMRPVYDFQLRYFAQRKVSRGKKTHFYHAPAYRALVNEYYTQHGDAQAHAQALIEQRGSTLNRVLVGGAALATLLAFYGIYVTIVYA